MVMMLHLWVVVSMGGGEQVDHACIWALVRVLRIIWNEMQSLMIGLIFVRCRVRSID